MFTIIHGKVIMQGKFFQRCAHLLYCSVLSLGGYVNKKRMSKPDMGSIFHIKNQWIILVIGSYYVNYQNFQNSMLLSSSDTKRTLMFTNSAYSICMQSIRSCNKLYLHYNLGFGWVCVQQMNDKGNLRIMLSNFLSLLCQINLLNLVSMWYSTYSQVHWRKKGWYLLWDLPWHLARDILAYFSLNLH